MAVKDILIENAVLQSRKGLVCIEAESINLKNVALLTSAKTVMQFQNSRNVTLDKIRYADNTDLLMHVTGDRSRAINLLNTDTSHAKKTVTTDANAPTNALTVK